MSDDLYASTLREALEVLKRLYWTARVRGLVDSGSFFLTDIVNSGILPDFLTPADVRGFLLQSGFYDRSGLWFHEENIGANPMAKYKTLHELINDLPDDHTAREDHKRLQQFVRESMSAFLCHDCGFPPVMARLGSDKGLRPQCPNGCEDTTDGVTFGNIYEAVRYWNIKQARKRTGWVIC